MSTPKSSFRSDHPAGESDASVQAKGPNVLFQRMMLGDDSAIRECIYKYGNWIWKISSTFSDSEESAENTFYELFRLIWKNAERISNSPVHEKALIAMIASVEIRFPRNRRERVTPHRPQAGKDIQSSHTLNSTVQAIRAHTHVNWIEKGNR